MTIKKYEFDITVKHGDDISSEAVLGYRNDLFGVHKSTHTGLWFVTHLGTGKYVTSMTLLKNARGLAEHLSELGSEATIDEIFESARDYINERIKP